MKTSKLSIDDSLINDITCINNKQCNDNEECNIDVEASNIKSVMESGDAENENEFVMESDTENQNEYVCNFINDNDHNSFSFHNDDRVENNLLKLILEIGAPNYAFKKILNWAKDAYSTGYQFNPRSTTYKSQIKMIEKHSNLEFLRPTIKKVALPPDNLMVDVTCYDFSSMLSALMNNKDLNQLLNLVVNPKDPFAKYVSPTGKLGEVNSGYWFIKHTTI